MTLWTAVTAPLLQQGWALRAARVELELQSHLAGRLCSLEDPRAPPGASGSPSGQESSPRTSRGMCA